MPASRWRRAFLPLAVLAFFAGSFAGGAWGSHQFTDVPDSNPFHDDIDAIADAGITTGFPDGGYHPTDPVSRQGMAAFMHRGFTRTDGANTFSTFSDTAVHNLASATITAGGEDSGGGFVVVIADATFSTASEASCPCKVGLSVTDGSLTTGQRNETVSDEASPDGSAFASVTTASIFSIPAGETRTYTAQGFRIDSDAATSPSTSMASNLVALYVPFSGDGDNSL